MSTDTRPRAQRRQEAADAIRGLRRLITMHGPEDSLYEERCRALARWLDALKAINTEGGS